MLEGFEDNREQLKGPEKGAEALDVNKALGEFAGSLHGLENPKFKDHLPPGLPSVDEQKAVLDRAREGDMGAAFDALYAKMAQEPKAPKPVKDSVELS